MPAGLLVRHAVAQAMKMVGGVACEHHIGTCHCPYERFHLYQEPNSQWRPSLIALLASTNTQEGARILESSLILHFECTAVNIEHNYNLKTRSAYRYSDPSESGPRYHFVYIAVKQLPPTAAAASAHPPLEPIGDMTQNREGTRPSSIAVEGLARHLLEDGWDLA